MKGKEEEERADSQGSLVSKGQPPGATRFGKSKKGKKSGCTQRVTWIRERSEDRKEYEAGKRGVGVWAGSWLRSLADDR